ncbi:MAG: FecR domain-containing protein, partial [Elusimicrobia bacterium]|nr:FecR domain-containing protein [Elusimicrobiota bacterium]
MLATFAAAAFLASVPATAQDDGAQSSDARLVTSEGEVFIYSGDAPDDGVPADEKEQAPLQAGDRVHTGADGRAEIGLEGDSILELGPNSDFTVNKLQSEETDFMLGWGRLIAKIKKLGKDKRLVVRTPTAVAAVRGTEFGVEVAEDEGETHVAVFDEGKVAVSGSEDERETMLSANKETEIKRGEGPRKAAKLRH